jgi:hypothetical protein
MENPAQIIAARVMRGSTVTVVPCVKILRGIDIASRGGARFLLSMKFIYQSGTAILTQESTQEVSASTPVLNFDSITALIRPSNVTLSQAPDAGTQLVAAVKITITDSSGTVDLSEAHTATFIV